MLYFYRFWTNLFTLFVKLTESFRYPARLLLISSKNICQLQQICHQKMMILFLRPNAYFVSLTKNRDVCLGRFPEDKTPLFKLMLNSQACFILLYLKNFLMKLYGFTDAYVKNITLCTSNLGKYKNILHRRLPKFMKKQL